MDTVWTDEARLTYATLMYAATYLAYLNAPVGCRVSPDAYLRLKLMFGSTSFTGYTITNTLRLRGLRIIVDHTLTGTRIEFRDKNGKITDAFELQQEILRA